MERITAICNGCDRGVSMWNRCRLKEKTKGTKNETYSNWFAEGKPERWSWFDFIFNWKMLEFWNKRLGDLNETRCISIYGVSSDITLILIGLL